MTLQVRRVVTGHDAGGRGEVKIDEVLSQPGSRREGQWEHDVWATDPDRTGRVGAAEQVLRTADARIASGSVLRVVKYAPGVAPYPHGNDWIDYTIILSGEIVMELENAKVALKAGDVVVQRGTIHNWINRSDGDCTIAFIRVGAKPVAK
jgi:quercetin dioxygenase-like cupin family protein